MVCWAVACDYIPALSKLIRCLLGGSRCSPTVPFVVPFSGRPMLCLGETSVAALSLQPIVKPCCTNVQTRKSVPRLKVLPWCQGRPPVGCSGVRPQESHDRGQPRRAQDQRVCSCLGEFRRVRSIFFFSTIFRFPRVSKIMTN